MYILYMIPYAYILTRRGCTCVSFHYRDAQPRSSEDQCHAIFDKGQRIEQEFAEFFTGKMFPAYFYFSCQLSTIVDNLHIYTQEV